MFNLLCELHFWSQKDGIIVDNSDFGVFVHQDRKSNYSCPIYEGKKWYSENRRTTVTLHSKRPKKLRDSLVEFEELFYDNRVVFLGWKCSSVIRVVFDNGLQSYIKVNQQTGDPDEFIHDKFMVGKLSSNYICNIGIHSHHAVFAYTDNHVTHALISKPSLTITSTKKWNHLDVKLQNVELAGPSGRRLDKILSYNITGDMVLIWWKCGRDEVYPWSPQVKAEDRANVHVYSLNGTKFDLVSYYRTKFEPVSIVFSRMRHSTIYTIQQRVNDEGEVTLEWENAELDCRVLRNVYSLSVPLPTHISALNLSPKEDKLLATCIDGSILIADNYGNITNRVRTNFIPNLASWHPDGALILIGNNNGQLQWFDSALGSVTCQIVDHDDSSMILDVGCYFKYQPNLIGLYWNRHINTVIVHDDYHDFVLLQFEKGPLVVMKILTTRQRRLSVDTIVYHYLSSCSYTSALNLLYTVDWEVDSELALSALQSCVSFLIRQPLSPSTESAIEKSLGYFLNPIRPIPESIVSEVGDGILDLARKFFHLLLRHQCFDKAFRLAIDLGKQDLFMDLHYYYKEMGNHVMSAAALERADELVGSSCDGSGSSCDCTDSHTSSDSSESVDTESESIAELEEKIVPALPIVTALESGRNKVCYSSILQQHNYRRNPPKLPLAQSPRKMHCTVESVHPTTHTNCFSQQVFLNDYFRKDQDSMYSSEIDNDSSFMDDDLIHHPNIPSSRAPLQFHPSHSTSHNLNMSTGYSEAKNDILCSKVLSGLNSDQHVGIPYSLKVANVRRKPVEYTVRNDDDSYNSPSHLAKPAIPNGNSGNTSSATLHRLTSYSPAIANATSTSKFCNGQLRMRPDGLPKGENYTEHDKSDVSRQVMYGADVKKMYPTNATNRLQGSSSNVQNLHVAEVDKSGASKLEFGAEKSSFSFPTFNSDVIDRMKKNSELPIIASAETEDGKIKVVHFGLV